MRHVFDQRGEIIFHSFPIESRNFRFRQKKVPHTHSLLPRKRSLQKNVEIGVDGGF